MSKRREFIEEHSATIIDILIVVTLGTVAYTAGYRDGLRINSAVANLVNGFNQNN